jgi:hypothetical protein
MAAGFLLSGRGAMAKSASDAVKLDGGCLAIWDFVNKDCSEEAFTTEVIEAIKGE